MGMREARGGRGGLEVKRRLIQSHQELEVYRVAFDAAMRIFQVTQGFPQEEKYSLTDQIRRSSRSVCANLAEAWRKRRYEAAFVLKLSDAEAEAAETQTWLEFAMKCNYMNLDTGRALYQAYDNILGKLVNMMSNPSPWILSSGATRGRRTIRAFER
jgi:four helix bundle protein